MSADRINLYQRQQEIFAAEAEVTPSVTGSRFLWQEVVYSPEGPDQDFTAYYRAYAMVTPADLLGAIAVVRGVALERSRNGQETAFKWLLAKASFAEITGSGGGILGQYQNLAPEDPLITFYMRERDAVKEILGKCAVRAQWPAIEQHRVQQYGAAVRNDSVPYKSSWFGQKYYSLTYVRHRGHSTER